MSAIKMISGRDILVRGDQRSGWSPQGSSISLHKPVRNVSFDFRIEFDGAGYLMCYRSEQGDLYGDSWYETLTDAMEAASEMFGISSNEWQDIS